MKINERFDLVKKNSLCFNCLSKGHSTSFCSRAGRYRTCNSKHHSLIHKEKEAESPSSSQSATTTTLSYHSNDEGRIRQALLATAVIQVKNGRGGHTLCRALLDGGSTSSFVTTSCFQRLGLLSRSLSTEVLGLASTPVVTPGGMTHILIKPHFQASYSFQLNALIMHTVTGKLPTYECRRNDWSKSQRS